MISDIDDPLFQALCECGGLAHDARDALALAFRDAAADPVRLAEKLQPLGVLTRYQLRKVQIGRAFELIFGDYLVTNKIGEGGMGKVYHAVQRGMGTQVALKIVRTQLLSNKTVMKRYEREARAAQQLDHPNIVKLIDAGDVHGKYFLAMEFVDGSDLSRLVKENGPLPYPEACEYIRQAALGLQHAHDLRFIHRDIKPSNLLVYGTRATVGTSWSASVKILDMGLVRSLEDEDQPGHTDLTHDGTVVGTPDYMAPEQAKNSSEVDSRADLYALGCTLYYLIRGQPPFPKGNSIDKLLAHQIDPVPDLRAGRPDLPPMLADVVARLLRKQPEERYQTAREVAAAVAPFTPDALTFDLSDAAPGGIAAFSFDPVNMDLPNSSKLSGSTGMRQSIVTTPSPVATPVATPAPTPEKRAAAVRPVKTPEAKPIPKPVDDDSSSANWPATRAKVVRKDTRTSKRVRNQKRPPATRRFPLIAVVVVVSLVAMLLLVAAIYLSRTGKGNQNPDRAPPGYLRDAHQETG